MFHLLSTTDWRRIAITEGPGFLVSMLIAENFYKFHSFTLECMAFLTTWYVVSRLGHALIPGMK